MRSILIRCLEWLLDRLLELHARLVLGSNDYPEDDHAVDDTQNAEWFMEDCQRFIRYVADDDSTGGEMQFEAMVDDRAACVHLEWHWTDTGEDEEPVAASELN